MRQISVNSYLAFGALVFLVWGYIYFQTLQHMVTVWSQSETYKHCFFILPITLYLLYEKRALLHSLDYHPTWLVIVPLLITQVLFVLAQQLSVQLVSHFCAVTSLILIIWTLVGNSVFKIIAFPIFYLYFAVPFGEELVPHLQVITADISCQLLIAVGIPVYREGLYLYLPNGTFHVAEACAGIRFLIGTFALGVLLAYLNYQRLWKRLLFSMFCAFVPIIANGIRAFGIMVIGYTTDMQHAVGADHLVYGWFFFLFVLIILFFLGGFGNDPQTNYTDNGKSGSLQGRISVVFTSILVLLFPLLSNFEVSNENPPMDIDVNYLLHSNYQSVERGTFSWMEVHDDSIQPTWSGFLKNVPLRLTYRNDSDAQELVSSLHRPFNDDEFSLLKAKELIRRNNNSYEVIKIQNVQGHSKSLLIWYQLENRSVASALSAKWQQFLNRMSGKRADGYYVVAEIPENLSVDIVLNRLGSLPLPPVETKAAP
ncbi:Transmembrane protein EpsH [Alteromonas infernus]